MSDPDSQEHVEFPLLFDRHWNTLTRRWTVPGNILGAAKNVQLVINGEQVGDDKFSVNRAAVTLADSGIEIDSASRVVLVFQLPITATGTRVFPREVVVATIAAFPAALSAILVYLVSAGSAPVPVAPCADGAGCVLPAWGGSPLASYDFYPVVVAETGRPEIDIDRLRRALHHLVRHDDDRAVADLIYLVRQNNLSLRLSPAELDQLSTLVERHDSRGGVDAEAERSELMANFARIVDGVGLTLSGTPFEIVLHDVRNPMRTVVAIQNPITGRRVGDPLTNFGVRLIRHYADADADVGPRNYVSYPLRLLDGTPVKSTTIPLFHPRLGLVGFICININVGALTNPVLDTEAISQLWIEPLTRVDPRVGIEEEIDGSGLRVDGFSPGVFAGAERE